MSDQVHIPCMPVESYAFCHNNAVVVVVVVCFALFCLTFYVFRSCFRTLAVIPVS